MNNYFIGLALIILVVPCIAQTAQSAEARNSYIGVGGNYAIENFDGGNYDNSWGANLKFGHSIHPLVDLEFLVDYLDNFEGSDSYRSQGGYISGDSDVTVATYMVALKGYFQRPTAPMRIGVVVGGGLMYAESDTQVVVYDTSYSSSFDDTDLGLKVGLSADIYATPELSIGFEGNYTIGFNDLEGLEYFNFTLGVAYHF